MALKAAVDFHPAIVDDGTCARCGGPFDRKETQPVTPPSARERLEGFMAQGSPNVFAWCPVCLAEDLTPGPEVDTCKSCESTMELRADGRWYPVVSEKWRTMYRDAGYEPPEVA